MKKKKTKKNRIVLIFCTILVCLCSVISFIPFKQDKLVVKADTVVSDSLFVSSDLFVPTAIYSFYYDSNGNRKNGTLYGVNSYQTTGKFEYLYTLFNLSLRNNQDTGNLQFRLNFRYLTLVDSQNLISNVGVVDSNEYVYLNLMTPRYDNYINGFNDSWLNVNDWSTSDTSSGILVTNSSGLAEFLPNSTDQVQGIFVDLLRSDSPIDLTKMSYMSIQSYASTSGYSRYEVYYYDTNANYIGLTFWCGKWSISLPSRTYYFNNSSLTDNEAYNQGFSAGQTDGYNNGYTVGQSQGYNEGYNVGQNVGYNNGYTAGTEDSNQYTFLNLISATIDAPVKYFQSLFNFELLGVNLQGFLTGLFTLCVIVTIVKLCLGG